MNNVAHFSIISFDEFKEIFENKTSLTNSKTKWTDDEKLDIYKRIQVPEKQGPYYVFKNLNYFRLSPKSKIVIPLGIKVEIIEDSYILNISKYNIPNERYKDMKVSAFSVVPFFTSDYEGNLYLLIENTSENSLHFETNEIIASGVFIPTGIAF